MAMLPAAPLPAVPAVEPPAVLVEPGAPAPEVAPAPLAAPPLLVLLPGDGVELVVLPPLVLPMLEAAAVRALVSMKLPLPIGRDVLDGAPAVPLVPVAPGVLPLP